MNWPLFLADVVVFVHVLFVGFVVLAVPVILFGWWRKWKWVRNFWFRAIHLLMMAIVVVETLSGIPCPLTVWERDLRLRAGQLHIERYDDGEVKLTEDGHPRMKANKEYDQDFVGRLLHRIIFLEFDVLTPAVLEVCYYIFGGLILITLFLVPPRWPVARRKHQTIPSS